MGVGGFLNEMSGELVDSAICVHRAVGPGLLESVYEACLVYELRQRGIEVRSQVPVPVKYRGRFLEKGFPLDLLVEEEIIVEIKSVSMIMPIHRAQLLTYLRLSHKTLGLLLNFNVLLMKNGIERFVNSVPKR